MKYTLVIFVFTLFISCNDSEETDFAVKNEMEIQEYITANNLNAQKSATGLYYVVNEEGTGEQPTTASNVTVAYKGYFTDNSVFDQSGAEGISFNLQQVIAGWTEGITYFKEGGSGILLVPSALGYGSSSRAGIPGGSVLIFEVDLVEVN
ncbi:FKBP-type peptidyl-prolyl cis-trans isomerase [Kriegella aquimaris]|uniref:Peptidyl-prolyl cis-trans isomerase n=1 Tax=Kriegella aquimaris TaxID=192904 RepID=A0A1G9KBB9_9FLAO|nr:FKBP-type peptidyl-prolyl cis-trans isomerase [Kriegella aquimaris]SDL47230.1 FKBP-type peptidyl-prolyl cis-trans isomerase [Kriegella aquimaris]